MHNLNSKYDANFTAGGLLHTEFIGLEEIVLSDEIEESLKLNDGDIFKVLENIPEKKHHCIQLAVKTMHKGIKEYKTKKIL